MFINEDKIDLLNQNVSNSSSVDELKKVLYSGHEIRLLSGKNTRFWHFDQKELHRRYDEIYQSGVKKLVDLSQSGSAISSLSSRIQNKIFPYTGKDAANVAKIGAAGFAGWLVGWVYDQSKSNLILHEYGHAWMANQIYQNANPHVSTISQYWFSKGMWYKWLWGVRKGAPGNWTSYSSGPLTHFGHSLTPLERNLLITSAGLGAELIANTAVAGLGLLAIRKKQRALGASLIGFSIISNSVAHSYIRRGKELLEHWNWRHGGDPPIIASQLAKFLHATAVQAFRLLYYGYIFLPVVILGLFISMFIKVPHDIPEESVLMRLLVQEKDSPEIKELCARVEIEAYPELQNFEAKTKDQQEKAIVKITDLLLQKIHENSKANALFNKVRTQISKELKGTVGHYLNYAGRLRAMASIFAFAAYELRNITHELLPALKGIFTFLSSAFVVLQSIASMIDIAQMVHDLANPKLSHITKAISVAQTILSITTTVVISVALFTATLNGMILPFLLIAAAVQLVFFGIKFLERRRLGDTE